MIGFLVRFSGLACIVLAIGCASFAMLLRANLGDDERTDALFARVARTGAYAGAGIVVLGVARLLLQLDALRFPGDPLFTSFQSLLGTTVWGKAWMAQMMFGVVTAGAFAAARRARQVIAFTSVSLTVLAVTYALSGHAAAVERLRVAAIGGDALHVLTAGAWIGTLAVMVMNWHALRELIAIEALVRAFSPIALVSAGVVVLSGVMSALFQLASPGAVFTTRYGQILLAKVALVVAVMVAGWFNWKRHTPRIGIDGGASLRRGAGAELAMALVVLAITAVLVTTSPE